MNTERTNESAQINPKPNTANWSRQQDDNVIEIDLAEIFFALLNSWKSILLALLIGAAIFSAYHTFLLKPSYQAEASFYITNTNSIVSSFSDLQLSSALTDDYANIIKSRGVLNSVIDELDLDMDYKELAEMISVNNPDSTHIITVTVTTDDPDKSQNIVNTLIVYGIEQITEVIGNGEPTIIDTAAAADVEDVTTGFAKHAAIGGILGALIACVLVVVRILLDTTMKTEDDIDKYLQLPVLAAVPYYRENGRK